MPTHVTELRGLGESHGITGSMPRARQRHMLYKIGKGLSGVVEPARGWGANRHHKYFLRVVEKMPIMKAAQYNEAIRTRDSDMPTANCYR